MNTYIPLVNESHVEVTAASAQFALDEIRNNPLNVSDANLEERYRLVQNPVGSEIHLRLNNNVAFDEIRIQVYSLAGQRLISEVIKNPSQQIRIPQQLGSGIYLLEIQDAYGTTPMKIVVD